MKETMKLKRQKLSRLLNLIAKAVVKPEGLHPHFHWTVACLKQVLPPIEPGSQREYLSLPKPNPFNFNTILNPPHFHGQIS
jgi:hypothetical protein